MFGVCLMYIMSNDIRILCTCTYIESCVNKVWLLEGVSVGRRVIHGGVSVGRRVIHGGVSVGRHVT